MAPSALSLGVLSLISFVLCVFLVVVPPMIPNHDDAIHSALRLPLHMGSGKAAEGRTSCGKAKEEGAPATAGIELPATGLLGQKQTAEDGDGRDVGALPSSPMYHQLLLDPHPPSGAQWLSETLSSFATSYPSLQGMWWWSSCSASLYSTTTNSSSNGNNNASAAAFGGAPTDPHQRVPLVFQTHQQRIKNAKGGAKVFGVLSLLLALLCYSKKRYDTINKEHAIILAKNDDARRRAVEKRRAHKKDAQRKERRASSSQHPHEGAEGGARSVTSVAPTH